MTLDDSDDAWQSIPAPAADEPHSMAIRKADRQQINEALAALPVAYREVLVLREFEDLSYNDIARIADIPVGFASDGFDAWRWQEMNPNGYR